MVDSTAPKRRRYTSYVLPRQWNDSVSSPRSPSNRFSQLLPGQKHSSNESADREDARRGVSTTVPATPEGAWKQQSPLRNARTMFPLSPSFNPEDTAGIQHTPLPAGFESPVHVPHGPYSPEPFILIPQIVVTPEYSTLDEGVVTLWAAVQLSTQVCQANAPDQKHHDAARRQTRVHSSESSTSGEYAAGL